MFKVSQGSFLSVFLRSSPENAFPAQGEDGESRSRLIDSLGKGAIQSTSFLPLSKERLLLLGKLSSNSD